MDTLPWTSFLDVQMVKMRRQDSGQLRKMEFNEFLPDNGNGLIVVKCIYEIRLFKVEMGISDP